MEVTFTDAQLYLIGIVASLVLSGLKLLYVKFGENKIKREWVTIFLFLISLGLAGWWFTPAFPAFPVLPADPASATAMFFAWLEQAVTLGATFVGIATLIYNLLFKKVYDKLEEKVRVSK